MHRWQLRVILIFGEVSNFLPFSSPLLSLLLFKLLLAENLNKLLGIEGQVKRVGKLHQGER